jgi:Ca2+-binding RTX toxin-like protein
MVFNGANVGEQIDVSADGERVRFFRDVGAVTMDLDGVELISFNARGGADTVVVNDLAGTSVTRVSVDLAAIPGSGTGDALADSVIVNGTPKTGVVDIQANGAAVVADGLAAEVAVTGGEPGLDRLVVDSVAGERVNVNGSDAADTISLFGSGTDVAVSVVGFNVLVVPTGGGQLAVNGLGGDDTIVASFGLPATIPLILDGGAGNDTIVGGPAGDTIIGGTGNDRLDGGLGADTLLGGDDDDTFIWNPGGGSDVIEGQGGNDTLIFGGSNVGEAIDISAQGDRVRFFRNIALVAMDLGGVENIEFDARGGADTIVVNDLAGTSVKHVRLELAAIPGTGMGDALTDMVIVNGTAAGDTIAVTANGAGGAIVSGLAATVEVAEPEATDQLVVNGLGGVDAFTVDPAVHALLTLIINQD